MFDISFVA